MFEYILQIVVANEIVVGITLYDEMAQKFHMASR